MNHTATKHIRLLLVKPVVDCVCCLFLLWTGWLLIQAALVHRRPLIGLWGGVGIYHHDERLPYCGHFQYIRLASSQGTTVSYEEGTHDKRTVSSLLNNPIQPICTISHSMLADKPVNHNYPLSNFTVFLIVSKFNYRSLQVTGKTLPLMPCPVMGAWGVLNVYCNVQD
jgi:hypothetical protein